MVFFIYLVCFLVGLVFTILSALLGHAFGGHEAHVDVGGHADLGSSGHAEAGLDQDGMPGISALSPTTIASFVTAFGGFGMIFHRLEATRNALVSAPLAALSALAVAAAVFFLFEYVFSKTQSSSESRVASLVGQIATVITPIPAGGVGEIAYVQAGTRYSAPAREESGAAVASGQSVKISRVVGTQFYVKETLS